jgi:non-specific riboncleoside hydrolase
MSIPIILDMDPGIDDAAAISIALNNPEFNVLLITSVAGNTIVENTTNNELKLINFFNRFDIPVAKGADKPLKKDPIHAHAVHGKTGMDGYDDFILQTAAIPTPAVEKMAEILFDASEPITIIATGAFTNIAQLISEYPEVIANIKEIITMGGSLSKGNITPFAEFNIYADPTAAKILFDSKIPKTMIGLDITLKTLLSIEDIQKISSLNKTGKMLASLFSHYHDNMTVGKPMHDVNTLYYLLDRSRFKTLNRKIDIVTSGEKEGQTILGDIDETTEIGFDVVAPEKFAQWFIKEIENVEI